MVHELLYFPIWIILILLTECIPKNCNAGTDQDTIEEQIVIKDIVCTHKGERDEVLFKLYGRNGRQYEPLS